MTLFPKVEVTDIKAVKNAYGGITAEIISIRYQTFFFLKWKEDAVVYIKGYDTGYYHSMTTPSKRFRAGPINVAEKIYAAKLALAVMEVK